MTAIVDRTGDFTKKKYLYKFYKNGYTSRRPKYMAAGQYMGGSGRFISGSVSGNASMEGSVSGDSLGVTGFGDSNVGLSAIYKQSTDVRRKIDLSGLIMSFGHGSGTSGFGSVDYYEISIFDYRIRYTTSGNTIKVFYQATQLASATMAAGYTYLRLRELNGTLYFERSSDGITWTSWTNHAINFTSDITKDVLSVELSAGAGGNGSASAFLYSIDAADQHNQLLAIEGVALNELEFEEQINNPASATTISFPYNPLDVPAHFDEGNFVEIYTNFYDDGDITREGILDHNSDPILDENSQPIQGIFVDGNIPEATSIQKFSGFIGSIEYDYDNETIAVTFVSHGETMNNSIVRGLTDISTAVLSQELQNSNILSTDYRQSFTLTKMTKIDDILLYVSYGAGGGSQVLIGQGNSTIASSKAYTWSGGRPAGVYTYHFNDSVYLEAGTYWIKETGGLQLYYQNSDVYSGGGLERNTGGTQWADTGSDAYFIIKTSQPNFAVTLTGNSQQIATAIFAQSLEKDYSPLFLELVEVTDYNFSIGLNLDSAKNAINALYRQLPSGWYYEVDIGTNAVRIKNKSASFDHLLVFRRDFTGMKVTKDINNIINDVFYIGGTLVENGPKLTTQLTDTDSIADYRHGVAILTNDKVTRYDTAALLSDNTIGNNNAPRLTTEITLSAAKYNIEAVRKGHVVKIVNGDRDVLGATLVVASLNYMPNEITISLDSAPRNLSRTIDQIQRNLENSATSNAGAVV